MRRTTAVAVVVSVACSAAAAPLRVRTSTHLDVSVHDEHGDLAIDGRLEADDGAPLSDEEIVVRVGEPPREVRVRTGTDGRFAVMVSREWLTDARRHTVEALWAGDSRRMPATASVSIDWPFPGPAPSSSIVPEEVEWPDGVLHAVVEGIPPGHDAVRLTFTRQHSRDTAWSGPVRPSTGAHAARVELRARELGPPGVYVARIELGGRPQGRGVRVVTFATSTLKVEAHTDRDGVELRGHLRPSAPGEAAGASIVVRVAGRPAAVTVTDAHGRFVARLTRDATAAVRNRRTFPVEVAAPIAVPWLRPPSPATLRVPAPHPAALPLAALGGAAALALGAALGALGWWTRLLRGLRRAREAAVALARAACPKQAARAPLADPTHSAGAPARRAEVVHGQAVDVLTGRPVSGARVTVQDRDGAAVGTTHASRHGAFVVPCPPSGGILRVDAPGYHPCERTVRPGQRVVIALASPRAAARDIYRAFVERHVAQRVRWGYHTPSQIERLLLEALPRAHGDLRRLTACFEAIYFGRPGTDGGSPQALAALIGRVEEANA